MASDHGGPKGEGGPKDAGGLGGPIGGGGPEWDGGLVGAPGPHDDLKYIDLVACAPAPLALPAAPGDKVPFTFVIPTYQQVRAHYTSSPVCAHPTPPQVLRDQQARTRTNLFFTTEGTKGLAIKEGMATMRGLAITEGSAITEGAEGSAATKSSAIKEATATMRGLAITEGSAATEGAEGSAITEGSAATEAPAITKGPAITEAPASPEVGGGASTSHDAPRCVNVPPMDVSAPALYRMLCHPPKTRAPLDVCGLRPDSRRRGIAPIAKLTMSPS